jgi:hypothetical protein
LVVCIIDTEVVMGVNMEPEVVLVTLRGRPMSINIGRFYFSVEDGHVEHADKCKGTLEEYADAYDLALFAWENQIWDDVEEH